MILDDAEVAVVLAVLFSVGAAQKHGKQQNARVLKGRKEGRSSLRGFQRTRVVAKGLGTYALAKGGRNCEDEVTRRCLGPLRLSFSGGFPASAVLAFWGSRLGPVGENYTTGSSRGPFSRTTPPPSSQSPSTGATLILG
jgi:hypothetical protein